ncbi:MAG: 3-phosphoserine/phosphohydroxythreonine transaminase [Casimicrobiaceae bacterium]|nr:3-phosphoserine/phosphohydroxythreonine transaminase [Casimicrobiaceae bacterium]
MAYNFSAGPAMLPPEVIEQIRADFPVWHWQGVPQGASVIELSHRSRAFEALVEEAEANLRELLAIPNTHRVLFMHGGAWGQFSAVPLNLLREGESAAYLVSGSWSEAAAREAARFGRVEIVASGAEGGYTAVPALECWRKPEGPVAYYWVCSNETVHGNEVHELSALARALDAPLVLDASSHFLSRPMPVAHCGLIFAGAQKNVGPSGVTIVIVREDLIGRSGRAVPAILDYPTVAKAKSLANTPSTFAIYGVSLVLRWIKAQGGLAEMERRALARSEHLYGAIDRSRRFRAPVAPAHRSRMNVVFDTGDAALDSQFVSFCETRGLIGLKGHRIRGGLRASLYNAMPLAGVEALVAALEEFERLHPA